MSELTTNKILQFYQNTPDDHPPKEWIPLSPTHAQTLRKQYDDLFVDTNKSDLSDAAKIIRRNLFLHNFYHNVLKKLSSNIPSGLKVYTIVYRHMTSVATQEEYYLELINQAVERIGAALLMIEQQPGLPLAQRQKQAHPSFWRTTSSKHEEPEKQEPIAEQVQISENNEPPGSKIGVLISF